MNAACKQVWELFFDWNRLQGISSVKKKKKDLLRIMKELQLGVYSHGEPPANPPQKWRGEHLYRGEKEFGRSRVNKESMIIICDNLSMAELLPGKKEFFIFILGSAIIIGHEISPFKPI